MNVYLPNLRLPSAYQEVEYIQSSGTQWITTEVKLSSSQYIELKANITGNGNNYDKLYGGGTDGGLLFMQFNNGSSSTDKRVRIVNYSNSSSQRKEVNSLSEPTQGTDYVFKHTNTEFFINGVSQGTCTATTFTMNLGLSIFAMNYTGTTGLQPSRYKLYYFNVYNSDNSIANNFVPCYRKSDGVIGLYDLVNNQFYTNSGTGTFTKGSDVTMAELKNAYIGEFVPYTPNANTLLYLPLQSDLVDHGPNNISVTNNGVTLSDSKGVFNGSSYLGITGFNTYLTNTPFTVSFWIKVSSFANQDAGIIIGSRAISGTWYGWNIVSKNDNRIRLETQGGGTNVFTTGLSANTWYHVVGIFTSTTKYIYLNGSLVTSASSVTPTFISRLDIGYNRGNEYISSYFNGRLSQIIIENKQRTATEISNYYNNTKSTYGL